MVPLLAHRIDSVCAVLANGNITHDKLREDKLRYVQHVEGVVQRVRVEQTIRLSVGTAFSRT